MLTTVAFWVVVVVVYVGATVALGKYLKRNRQRHGYYEEGENGQ